MTLFFSITTLFLSLAVTLIAWQQWRIADNKLRLDLFDRRYKVYAATRNFLRVILTLKPLTKSHSFEFRIGTSDAEFLFEADVVNYLAQIGERAGLMRSVQELSEKLPVQDALDDEIDWFSDQTRAITAVFAPYLGFANVKLRAVPSFSDFFRRASRRFKFNKRG